MNNHNSAKQLWSVDNHILFLYCMIDGDIYCVSFQRHNQALKNLFYFLIRYCLRTHTLRYKHILSSNQTTYIRFRILDMSGHGKSLTQICQPIFMMNASFLFYYLSIGRKRVPNTNTLYRWWFVFKTYFLFIYCYLYLM